MPRGDVAEIAVRGCILDLINRQYLIRVRPAGRASAKLVVRFKPKDLPVLHWVDGEHLEADLGQVTAISPQIDQAGPVHITFTYGGANERQSATADLALRHDLRPNQVCAWKKQLLGNAVIARQF